MSTHRLAAEPAVTVIVPVFNEVENLDTALASVLAQRYSGTLEYVLIDGGSTDGTRERLGELAGKRDDVRVVDNARPGIAVSLNIGLANAGGDVAVRMDAHTRYGNDYVRLGVDALVGDRAEWAAGPAIAEGEGKWSRWVAAALGSRLGVGGADFRSAGEEHLTDAGFGGAIARRGLRELGGWDESWEINEDGELAARAHNAGWRILLVPAMAAHYIPRDRVGGLARQYWRYGLWRAKTSVHHPSSMRPSHALPPLLVLAIPAAFVPLIAWPARAALTVYLLSIAGASVLLAQRAGGLRGAWRIAVVLVTMHVAWGAGNLMGFVRFGNPLPALGHVIATVRRRL